MSIIITLSINIGNDTMLSDHDVANALEGVASRFRDARYVQTVADEGERQGYSVDRPVFDGLGNTVGEFHVTHVNEDDDSCTHDVTFMNQHDHNICSDCGMDLGR